MPIWDEVPHVKNLPGIDGLLTIRQAAELLHVPLETLRQWDKKGRLRAVRRGTRGIRRYRLEDIVRVRDERGLGSARSPASVSLLSGISAMLRVVASTLDERAIGQTVVDEAVKLLAADRSAIYFFDEAYTVMLPFVAVDVRDPSTIEAVFYSNPVPVAAQPLFSELLATHTLIAISDTYDDPRTTRAFFESFDTRALIIMPLLTREQRLIGVLGFFWSDRVPAFGDDELALADALGRQAAISFENARLCQLTQARAQAIEREQRRQELLAEASKLFSALLEEREVLDQIARLVCESMGDSATITLFDTQTQHVRVAGSYQKDRGYSEVRKALESEFSFSTNPLVLHVLRTGQPILSNNPAVEQGYDTAWDLAAFILVPLVYQGRVFGTLGVSTVAAGQPPYDDDDLRVMLALADRAALALENARLFAESERSRRQAEAHAYELEAIFRHVPAGLAVYDTSPEFRCIRHNDAFLRLVGYDWQAKGSLIDIPLGALFDEDSYEATRRIFETVCTTGKVFTVAEYPAVLPPDPQPRYYKWSLTPLKSHTGEIGGLLISAIEITEQVSARQRVQELARLAEARATQMKTIIESIADGVWVTDANGAVVEINRRGVELLGLLRKQEHLLPQPDAGDLLEVRYVNGAPMPPDEYPLARALLNGQPAVGEMVVCNLQSGQDTYLQISAAPLRDGQGRIAGAVAVGCDITESFQLMRQKDEFLSVVSHELKTPITSIRGFSQAMERRFKQKLAHYTPNPLFEEHELKQYSEQLGVVVRQTGRLQRLVDDLLDLSSLHVDRVLINRSRLNIAQLLIEVVERMQVITSTHHIHINIPDLEVWVDADEARLEQVLTNLLQNAIKYSPLADHVDVSLQKDQQSVTISVRDYGIGIPASDQQHLFGRFFRASNASANNYGGLGLGLYISSEIIKRHGGQIGVDSQQNAGSTFSFSLPLPTAHE